MKFFKFLDKSIIVPESVFIKYFKGNKTYIVNFQIILT